MSAVLTPVAMQPLKLEAAIAARIIRSGYVPRDLFQWLSSPADKRLSYDGDGDDRLCVAIDELLLPLLADASPGEKRQLANATPWLANVCSCVADYYNRFDLGIGPRLLAASLLPLYRCLATGGLHEGFEQTRLRLSELLTLVALCHEVGIDFVRVLNRAAVTNQSPDALVLDEFELALASVATLIRDQVDEFDVVKSKFSEDSVGAFLRFDRQDPAPKVPEWASAHLLWRLAGELLSQNCELILPRSWIDTPVPWSSIADHWNMLERLLSPNHHGSAETEIGAAKSLAHHVRADASRLADISENRKGQPHVEMEGELTDCLAHEADQDSDQDSEPAGEAVSPHSKQAAAASKSPEHSTPERATDGHSQRRRNPNGSRTTTQSPDAGRTSSAQSQKKPSSDVVLPRVMIAEIRTHNDPAFVNVLQRQIASCRAEDLPVSLASIVVHPEHEHDRQDVCGSRDNGLTLWQQKLVNWLADHPQIVDPYAFLTAEGELVLCLINLERGETTSLLRHGLVEVLTGRQIDDQPTSSSLSKVAVPAKYHVGIASASTPNAGFTPHQLIEPAIRCLSAASRQGKSSIKSIEVF